MNFREYVVELELLNLKGLKSLVHHVEVDDELTKFEKKKLIKKANEYMKKYEVGGNNE